MISVQNGPAPFAPTMGFSDAQGAYRRPVRAPFCSTAAMILASLAIVYLLSARVKDAATIGLAQVSAGAGALREVVSVSLRDVASDSPQRLTKLETELRVAMHEIARLRASAAARASDAVETAANPIPASHPSKPLAVRKRLRVVVYIAVVLSKEAHSTAHLATALTQYKAFHERWDTVVHVDTNDVAGLKAELGDAAQGVDEFREWRPDEVGGDFQNLPRQHRVLAAAAAAAGSFDYMLYAEDDMLVTGAPAAAPLRPRDARYRVAPLPPPAAADAMAFFIKHEAPLAARGWALNFLRVETSKGDGKAPVVIENEPRRGARVYHYSNVTAAALPQLFAQPRSCYAAAYALSAASVRAVVQHEPELWTKGFPDYQSVRERFGIGAAFWATGTGETFEGFQVKSRGWRMRCLIGVHPTGVPDASSLVRHLPNSIKPSLLNSGGMGTSLDHTFDWENGAVRIPEPLPLFPPPYSMYDT